MSAQPAASGFSCPPLASAIRYMNLATVAGIIFVAIHRLTGDATDVRSAMLTIYFFFFAVLIFSAETTRGYIVHLFGFLTGYYGRGMFLTFIDVMIGIILIGIGIANVMLKTKGVTPPQNEAAMARAAELEKEYNTRGTNPPPQKEIKKNNPPQRSSGGDVPDNSHDEEVPKTVPKQNKPPARQNNDIPKGNVRRNLGVDDVNINLGDD